MQKFLKYANIDKLPILELEDKNNPLVLISKGTNTISYRQRGAETEAVSVRTSKPLTSLTVCAYFQIQVKSAHKHSQIAIGLINKDCSMKRHPGESNMSFGYRNNGSILLNRTKKSTTQNFGNGYRVGVGVNYIKREFFVTNEGQFKLSIPYTFQPLWTSFYPCASVKSDKDQAVFYFDEETFKFPFNSYLKTVLKQYQELIEAQTIGQDLTYKLVSDYLQFNGYQSSHKLFCDHFPSKEVKLKSHPFLMNKHSHSQEMIENEQKPEEQSLQRQRSMSQYWNIMVQSQLNEQFEEEELFMRRKSSLMSVGQLHKKSKSKRQKTEEDEINIEDYTFLKETRHQIINLVRQMRIDEAQSLLTKQIPQFYKTYPHIQNYFILHRIYQQYFEVGPIEAIKFIRNRRQALESFRKEVFPFYSRSQNKIIMIAFQEIANMMCSRENQLDKDQFYAFAYILNQLILSYFGLFSQSKLQLVLNHGACINKKAESYSVGGLVFNI